MTKKIFVFSSLNFFLLFSIKGCNTIENRIAYTINKDSVWVAPGKRYRKNPLHHFLFGKHYRKLWATPVKLPVFDIHTSKGGFKAVKQGGSFQSVSVHLKDTLGRIYVLRSVDKDPSKVLPIFLRDSYINNVVSDQTSASNPYGALIIDKLAEYAGVYHTHPTYFYVPKDADLNGFGESLKGKIAMLEEKPNATWKHAPEFGYPDNINSTDEMLETILKNQNATIDQEQFLRSRLFDLVINDWDRHADQWEWMKFKYNDSIVFTPLPRDRDAAFYLFDDGLLPFILTRFWGSIKFQSFHPNYENIEGLLFNSQYVDKHFLNKLNWQDWIRITKELQHNLSNEAIKKAVASWPKEVYAIAGEKTEKTLISRKNKLLSAARLFYEAINKNAIIYGTDKQETIEVNRANSSTFVKIRSEETGKFLYTRAFLNTDTHSISIYALGGDDSVIVSGKVKDGIKIRLFGGKGADVLEDRSEVSGLSDKTLIYDTKEGNTITFGSEAKDKTTGDTSLLEFNRSGKRR